MLWQEHLIKDSAKAVDVCGITALVSNEKLRAQILNDDEGKKTAFVT